MNGCLSSPFLFLPSLSPFPSPSLSCFFLQNFCSRSLQDSNLCDRWSVDFESTPLTTPANELLNIDNFLYQIIIKHFVANLVYVKYFYAKNRNFMQKTEIALTLLLTNLLRSLC